MSYLSELEQRPLVPIEIPRCEVIVPMPKPWFDFINRNNLDVVVCVETFVCASGGGNSIKGARPNLDFREVRGSLVGKFVPMLIDPVRVVLPMRKDVYKCVEIVALALEVTAHEILLGIIGRSMPIEKNTSFAVTVPRTKRDGKDKVVAGPWKSHLQRR